MDCAISITPRQRWRRTFQAQPALERLHKHGAERAVAAHTGLS